MTVKNLLMRATGRLARTLTHRFGRILMYHRFGEVTDGIRLGKATFERQLQYLLRYFIPVRLTDFVNRLRNGDRIDKLVALTIDDGYADFLDFAYPLLCKYQVPVTVYLVTRFIEQEIWLWPDAIRFVFMKAGDGFYDVSVLEKRCAVRLSDSASREKAWDELVEVCVRVSSTERERLLKDLQYTLGVELPSVPSAEYNALTWSQIQGIDRDLIEFGSHTCTHPIVSRCMSAEREYEIGSSKASIEGILDRPVVSFCYPNGLPNDYDWESICCVKKAGYLSAVVAHGSLIALDSDVFRLERIPAFHDFRLFQNAVDGFPHLRLNCARHLRSVHRKGGLGIQRSDCN